MRRHRTLLCVALALVFTLGAPTSFAHDFDRHNFHPLRYLAFPFHAAGVFVEYTFIRPIHYVVSQPTYAEIFGHQSSPDDDFWSWRVGSL